MSGPTFTVQRTDRNGATTTTSITTDASTTFTKVVSASQSTLAVGQCVAAVGPADQTGAVTANTISIRPPGPNGCFTGRGGQGGRGRRDLVASTAEPVSGGRLEERQRRAPEAMGHGLR